MIHISVTHPNLRNSLIHGFRILGLSVDSYNNGITINGAKKAKEFNKIVGFSNEKNILKYSVYLREGRVPKSHEIETFIRNRRNDSLMVP